MSHTLLWGGLALLFGTLFLVAEILHRRGVAAEHTRKGVHIGTGLLALLFPVLLHSTAAVAALCALFLLVLWWSKRQGWLQSIHGVQRSTHGSVLYPVIVAFSFAYYRYAHTHFSHWQPVYYFYVPVLTMAIADPVAAYAGMRWGDVPGRKSAVGSWACLGAALGVTVLLMALLPKEPVSLPVQGLLSLALAGAVSLAERLSHKGWDNFFIPLAAMAVQTFFEWTVL